MAAGKQIADGAVLLCPAVVSTLPLFVIPPLECLQPRGAAPTLLPADDSWHLLRCAVLLPTLHQPPLPRCVAAAALVDRSTRLSVDDVWDLLCEDETEGAETGC